MSRPLITPGETRTRCTVGTGLDKAGTGAGLELELMIPPITPSNWPPGIPPGTPPTTPPVVTTGGGASSSLIIWTFAGILLGVRSRPFAMLLVTFTTFAADGVDAAGGGGGGGGGGASRKMSNCCLGSTSVNHNGSKRRRPIRKNCKTNESRVDHVLLFRCATLESSRLSSNRTLPRAAEATGLTVSGSSALLLMLPIDSSFSVVEMVVLVTVSASQRVSLHFTNQQLICQTSFMMQDSILIPFY